MNMARDYLKLSCCILGARLYIRQLASLVRVWFLTSRESGRRIKIEALLSKEIEALSWLTKLVPLLADKARQAAGICAVADQSNYQ